MKFSEAKQEFDARHYRWALHEAQKEAVAAFPCLEQVKDGIGWETRQMMIKLKPAKRVLLAQALVKSCHDETLPHSGETLLADEMALLKQWRAFSAAQRLYRVMKLAGELKDSEVIRAHWFVSNTHASDFLGVIPNESGNELYARLNTYFDSIPQRFGDALDERRKRDEQVKFASKRKLRKEMTSQFKAAFGSNCIGLPCVDEWEELVFDLPCNGWILSTTFDFGRHESQLSYRHAVWNRRTFEAEDTQVKPFRCLGNWMAYALSLGVRSNEWPYLTDDDIEPTCVAVIEHCRRFFEAAPKLLEGLELETLTT